MKGSQWGGSACSPGGLASDAVGEVEARLAVRMALQPLASIWQIFAQVAFQGLCAQAGDSVGSVHSARCECPCLLGDPRPRYLGALGGVESTRLVLVP